MNNETRVTRLIKVVGFVDHAGLPTCSLKAGADDCRFLRSAATGVAHACMATGTRLRHSELGVGYLRPAAGCPVWGDA